MLQKLKFQMSNFKSNLKCFKFKYLSIHLLFVILILAFSSAPVHAQTPAVAPIPATVSPTSPLYTDLIVNNMFHTFSCLAIGSSVIGQPCLTYQSGIPVLSQVNLSGGALGATTSLIGMLYANPPVRTVDYLGSLGEQMGIVKPAHAQVFGSGAQVLNPIIKLWEVSRNISYVAMIIVFLIIGLMVLFRNRINPQTVITAQAALPGLVIGLILITFSYFLAALISDMAFVGTNVVGYYFSAVKQQGNNPQNLVRDISDQNVMSLMGLFLNGVTKDSITDGIGAFFNNLVDPAQRYVRSGIALAAYQFGSMIGPALGSIAAMAACGIAALPAVTFIPLTVALLPAALPLCAAAGGAAGAIGAGAGLAAVAAKDPPAVAGMGLWFIAMIIIIYAIFRLIMKLISNYLTIIFLVVTAPFHFLIASLPGRQGIATAWILSMLGNVLVFPAVLAVFYFIAFILGQSFGPFTVSGLNNGQSTIPPTAYAQSQIRIAGETSFPLFGGLNLGFINLLLAFGALVGLPALPDIINRTVGKAGQAGQLIGQEISSGIAGGQKYYGQAQGGLGAVQKDVSGLSQFGGGARYELDPLTGNIVRIAEPGILGRIRGRAPVRTPTPPCLPPNTKIATPSGPRIIKNIRKNDIVWTMDAKGEKRKTHVKEVVKRKVSENHKILWLVLDDGRQLHSSPGHPDATGRDLATLKKGDCLDNSQIINIKSFAYDNAFTYDILPEGTTGAYWANGILIGSTLKIKHNNVLHEYSQIPA